MIAHSACVAQLIVRNLEVEVVRRLKKRAGEHGVSMEEEHRRILRMELGAGKKSASFKDFLMSMPDVDEAVFQRDRSIEGRATKQKLFED
jgi:plasmid stability protein